MFSPRPDIDTYQGRYINERENQPNHYKGNISRLEISRHRKRRIKRAPKYHRNRAGSPNNDNRWRNARRRGRKVVVPRATPFQVGNNPELSPLSDSELIRPRRKSTKKRRLKWDYAFSDSEQDEPVQTHKLASGMYKNRRPRYEHHKDHSAYKSSRRNKSPGKDKNSKKHISFVRDNRPPKQDRRMMMKQKQHEVINWINPSRPGNWGQSTSPRGRVHSSRVYKRSQTSHYSKHDSPRRQDKRSCINPHSMWKSARASQHVLSDEEQVNSSAYLRKQRWRGLMTRNKRKNKFKKTTTEKPRFVPKPVGPLTLFLTSPEYSDEEVGEKHEVKTPDSTMSPSLLRTISSPNSHREIEESCKSQSEPTIKAVTSHKPKNASPSKSSLFKSFEVKKPKASSPQNATNKQEQKKLQKSLRCSLIDRKSVHVPAVGYLASLLKPLLGSPRSILSDKTADTKNVSQESPKENTKTSENGITGKELNEQKGIVGSNVVEQTLSEEEAKTHVLWDDMMESIMTKASKTKENLDSKSIPQSNQEQNTEKSIKSKCQEEKLPLKETETKPKNSSISLNQKTMKIRRSGDLAQKSSPQRLSADSRTTTYDSRFLPFQNLTSSENDTRDYPNIRTSYTPVFALDSSSSWLPPHPIYGKHLKLSEEAISEEPVFGAGWSDVFGDDESSQDDTVPPPFVPSDPLRDRNVKVWTNPPNGIDADVHWTQSVTWEPSTEDNTVEVFSDIKDVAKLNTIQTEKKDSGNVEEQKS